MSIERDNYPEHIERQYEFHVAPGQEPERLDIYLTHSIHNASRTKVHGAIESGAVLVNGLPTKPGRKVQPGDHIICKVMKPPPLELVPEDIPLNILYEDEDLLVVNKPAGMVTHPGFGNRYGTLVNALLYHFGFREALKVTEHDIEDEFEEELIFMSSAVRPGIVHRLDKDTSGILVVAKQPKAHAHLSKQFADRSAKREYWAMVWGVVKQDSGRIEGNIGRSLRDRKKFMVVEKDGKHAVTDYTVLRRYDFLTLISLKLRTGRTHQIRVHCSHIHHPLFSDETYGGKSIVVSGAIPKRRQFAEKLLTMMTRQALHAKMLGFRHPTTGLWMEFTSDLPEDFQTLVETLDEYQAEKERLKSASAVAKENDSTQKLG